MVVWKERQHEDDDVRARAYVGSIVALQGCGLLKLFHVPSMRSHVRLLEYILRMWNPKKQYFEVGAHVLTVEVEDIYFLIGLSKRGEHISLTGPRGRVVTTQELIDRHIFRALRCLGKRSPSRR